MEENSKQLLIRDICARLPYGVYVKFKQYNEPLCLSVKDALAIYNGGEIIDDLQYLYLRPMSSMTDEETDRMWEIYDSGPAAESSVSVAEYLYERHFDCHYLIEKGIALEAPEGMYKTE